MTHLISCAQSLLFNHRLTVYFDWQSFSTSNVFLAIPWAKQAFFSISFFLCELTVFVCQDDEFYIQFSRSFATGVFSLSFHSCALSVKRKRKQTLSSLFLYFLNTSEFKCTLQFERTLRACSVCHCSLSMSCSKALQSDSDCLSSSARDGKRTAMVNGLCSSQFPLHCFNSAETKPHFLHGRPIVWYRHMSTMVPKHFCYRDTTKLTTPLYP